MIVVSMMKKETIYDAVLAPMSGRRPLNCPVVSSAKRIEVSTARDAPANIAAIPTSAATEIEISDDGKKLAMAVPIKAPAAPPIVRSGASVPPEVPLPSAIDHD